MHHTRFCLQHQYTLPAKGYGKYLYQDSCTYVNTFIRRFNDAPECADKFFICPQFFSPCTGRNVYFIICPTHQVYAHTGGIVYI